MHWTCIHDVLALNQCSWCVDIEPVFCDALALNQCSWCTGIEPVFVMCWHWTSVHDVLALNQCSWCTGIEPVFMMHWHWTSARDVLALNQCSWCTGIEPVFCDALALNQCSWCTGIEPVFGMWWGASSPSCLPPLQSRTLSCEWIILFLCTARRGLRINNCLQIHQSSNMLKQHQAISASQARCVSYLVITWIKYSFFEIGGISKLLLHL